MAINKERYNSRVLNHLCTRCGEPVVPGKKSCQHHLDEAALKEKLKRERYKNKNLCMRCGKVPPRENKIYCEECFQKDKKYYPVTKKKYYNRKNNSLCTRCGIKVENSFICEMCQIYIKAKDKIGYHRHKANNLCVTCGEIKDIDGILCSGCKIVNDNRGKKRREKQKNIIFNHYGNKCTNCGEVDVDVLCIDHINGGGRKHFKQLAKNGTIFYRWIVKNNFPSDLQILCYNCNIKKYKQTLKQKSTEEVRIIGVGVPTQEEKQDEILDNAI